MTKAKRWKLSEDLRQFHKINTLRAILAFIPTPGEVLAFKKYRDTEILAKKDSFKHQFIFLTQRTEVKAFQSTNVEKKKKKGGRSQMNNFKKPTKLLQIKIKH